MNFLIIRLKPAKSHEPIPAYSIIHFPGWKFNDFLRSDQIR